MSVVHDNVIIQTLNLCLPFRSVQYVHVLAGCGGIYGRISQITVHVVS